MFEQESYNNATQVESQDSDLFRNYEIRNWNYSSTLYKILAISAVLNIAVLAFIGQTNLLTLRGCDSPFVGRVCQVLDMAYVGTVLFGTEREYVDMEYEKTDLGDAEITYIDVSGETPPLYYPADYFQIANPVQYAMLQQQGENAINLTNMPGTNFPGFSAPRNNDSDLLNQRATPPAFNPKSFTEEDSGIPTVKGDGMKASKIKRPHNRPSGSPSEDPTDDIASANGKDGNSKTVTPSPSPTPDAATVGLEEAQEDKFGVFINKRPLKDYAKSALENIDNKTVVLEKPVKVVIAGTLALGKDGKTIILKDPKPVRSATDPVNDPAMEKFVQDAILAVGDAGWFGYLDKFKVKNLVITVEQNDTNLVASVRSEQPSENSAKQTASGLNGWISLGAAGAKGDDLTFLKLAKTTSVGKTFILNFDIPKPLLQEMVLRKLAESKEKENKPNSTALVGPNNKSTSER